MKKNKNKHGIKNTKTIVNRTKKAKAKLQPQPVQTAGQAANVVVQNNVSYTPKVSVIIPVYNVAEYLRECLDSVINQTLKEIEIICVDDGSTDNSLEILKEYAAKDKRITVISRENKGVGFSRNEGIQNAKGEFIAFMDPDDFYPDLSVLATMYDAAIAHNVNICGGSLIVYDEKRKKKIEKKEPLEFFPKDQLYSYKDFQYDYGFQRYIYNRKFIVKNQIDFPNYRRFQDPPFMVEAFTKAGKFYALHQYVYAYRWAHKAINWTEEKVFHLLSGLRDDLLIAKEYALTKLFDLTLMRIKKEYKATISLYDTKRILDVKKEIMAICLQMAKLQYFKTLNPAKVSVILPIYNAEKYLKHALNSIINQTLKDIEIICVNDGSTDNSLQIIKEYTAKDKRIKCIDKPNAGYGHAMNCGMELATGEYIGIVEPDDFIKPEMYETLYKKAKELDLDVIKSDYIAFSNTSEKYISIMPKNFYEKVLSMAKDKNILGFTVNPTGLFKTSFLRRYQIVFNETPGASHQDIGFWALTTFYASRIYFLPVAFYMYRQDNTNSSMNSYAKPNIMLDEYAFIGEHLRKHPEVWELTQDIYFRRRHWSLMYFYNNRISPKDKSLFINMLQSLYQSDLEKYNFLNYLGATEQKEVESVLTGNMQQKIIPIVYATNKNYSIPCSVAIKSLIDKADKHKKYAIFVLHTELDIADISMLENLATPNVSIETIKLNLAQMISSNVLYTTAHYSKEMYYRILIPELLKQFDKVIYLDCDILVRNDISKLYEIDISNYVVGAVINPVFQSQKYIKDILDVSVEKYFNSGVLIINNKKFNELHLKQKCLDLLKVKQNLKFPDQDLLNIICKDNVLYLDAKWNYQWAFEISGVPVPLYCREAYKMASKNPNIVHYSSNRKPWNFNDDKYTLEWKKYCKLNYKREQKRNDAKQLQSWFLNMTGRYLNLDHPRTFNEKIQWLKLYDSTPLKTRLADKYLVREWIKEKIGEQYLIPLIGVYDKFDDIDFDKLPNQFVIKCNHGSGWNIIVKDKSQLNLAEAKEKIDKWMATDYSTLWGFELHYRNIVPKIIIEKYIEEMASALYDYRFFCSYGDVKQIWLDVYSGTPNHKRKIYDRNWNELNITVKWPRLETPVEKPQKLADMIHFAEILSKEFSLVRVDFYLINDHIYFGEMTFTSMSGIGLFNPEKEDLKLGNMIKLPELAYNIETGEYYKLPRRSQLKPYILFPYYLCKKIYLESQKVKYPNPQVIAQLSAMRVDIKNVGNENNEVEIKSAGQLSKPSWFSNAQGKGQVVESHKRNLQIEIKAIQNGILTLSFRGQYKCYKKAIVPLWVDYKSIKIDGKEISSAPIEVWHDKPFRYEMPVKDGQTVLVEIEQQPHKYSREELKDTIFKLFSNNEYIKKNISSLLKSCSMFVKPAPKKPSRLFSITQTGAKTTVYVLGLKLEFKNRQQEILQVLQQNQQAILQAVHTAARRNDKLEQQNTALSQQINAVNRELQQAKLWLKQTYETFPTLNKQLENAQETLLSQLVTERKVNRLAAIVSVEIKRQKKHHQEIRHLLSKFIADTQTDLRYLRNLDVAKTKQLQQAADKLAQQMQSAAQIQEKQLAGMQELLLSGQATLQYLKGVDVAKTEHVQQSADKLAQQMQSAAQMQEKQLAGMRELLVSGQSALQHLKGLNVVNPEQLQQTAERLVSQITGASQEQARLLNAVSGSLRQQQQEASSQAGHIVGSLETLQKNHKTEQEDIKKQLRTIQDKSLQQYRELNFADLLHDSTKHSPWLKDRSFALYGWAANYSFIYTLFRILDKVSPQHILEMGLGQTTRLTTQYIAYKNPSATLDVCEHNQDWIDIYTPELPKSGNIKVHHLDLEYFDYDGKPNDKYKNISGVCGGTKYNLIIVDGPVGGGKNFPRSNVVDLIPHNLAEDFIIIFDDAERPGEQNTIAQTKAKLTAQGIVFATQQRSALKSQFLIFSKSCEFVQYL
ncbi:glycosyltransferase [Candidatus Avelusimicrobium aviculae]|uniref:glycosyltransferase n=1 Tax=Candidatus Avelusimicrobium aviculae TaxID=3416206 RepID=UPI003D0C722F